MEAYPAYTAEMIDDMALVRFLMLLPPMSQSESNGVKVGSLSEAYRLIKSGRI